VKTALLFVAALITAGCASRGSLPSYGIVPDFSLTDQTGRVFDSRSELDGKVWLAHFMFTTCSGPCPRMTAQFRTIRDSARELRDFRLVSFTIDPVRDTPETLAAYSRAFGAEPEHWAFLTGEQQALNHLSWDIFKLGKVDGSLEHSTRFVLVDRKSRIRGYYDSRDKEAMDGLMEDIKALIGASI
jgi:protein SCO1/2